MSQWGLFLWLTATVLLTRGAMTPHHVPHIALGAELSTDYQERPQIVSIRYVFSFVGFFVSYGLGFAWFFRDTEAFPNGQFNVAAYEPYAISTLHARRQVEALPVLVAFKAWLDKQSVPPKTLLGKAIHYALAEWPRLLIYTQDERLSIDNNGIENAIRPFALGRTNWLFSDTQHGVRASAGLYSLIETAKANGLNDYAYLKWVLAQLPTATSPESIEQLLPWYVDQADLEAQLKQPP